MHVFLVARFCSSKNKKGRAAHADPNEVMLGNPAISCQTRPVAFRLLVTQDLALEKSSVGSR
jgi:hypothetical protein